MAKGKFIGSGILVVLVVAAFGYWRYAPPVYAADASLVATEDALAVRETIALGSVDIDYLNSLRTKYFGEATTPDLPAPGEQPASAKEALLAAIEAAGSMSRASVALYLTKDGALRTIVVLDGEFAPEKLGEALSKHSQASAIPSRPHAWTMRFEDVDSCSLSDPWSIYATKERVIAVDGPDLSMLQRLDEHAPAGRDLTRWQDFRRDRFAALVMFMPDALPERDLDPIVRMGAQQAQQNLKDEFNSLYLGAAMKPVLPKGELSVWLEAKTAQVASEKARTWSDKIAASRNEWSASMPTVAALHDRMRVEARSNVLAADIQIDRQLATQLRQLPGEFFGLMFGGFGVKFQSAASAAPEQERIDEKPRVFLASTSIAALPPFDAEAPFVETPSVMAGPFGIALTGIRLTDAEPRALELELGAAATQVANIGDDKESMMAFSVTSVLNREGAELLRNERCGRDRNTEPARPEFATMDGQLKASKKVRLIENITQADIASIEGNVRLRMAAEVETVSFAQAKVGDRLERDDLRIELTQVGPSSIAYRISGAVERLLHVRAKNASGQVLQRAGSSSFGDAAKSVQSDFRGQIASIEWIVARRIEEQEFPFELDGAHLTAQNGWKDRSEAPFQAYSKAELARELARPVQPKRFGSPTATAAVGPMVLDLNGLGSWGNVRLDFALFVPQLRSLDGSMSATQIQVDALTMKDGTVHRPSAAGNAWTSGLVLKGFADDLRGDTNLDTGIEVKRQDVASMTGRVILRVPRAVESILLSTAEVGTSATTRCGALQIIGVMKEELAIEGTGDPACIFGARALGADDRQMQMTDAKVELRPGTWIARLNTYGRPKAVELLAVKDVEQFEYPFNLQLTTQ